jgi:hypothetical protein
VISQEAGTLGVSPPPTVVFRGNIGGGEAALATSIGAVTLDPWQEPGIPLEDQYRSWK